MKKIFCLLSSLCLCLALCTCSKDKDPTPLEQLPPITNTGANTFGSLVNGKAVVITNVGQISGGFIGDADSVGWLPFDSSDVWLVFETKEHSINIFLNDPIVTKSWQLCNNTLPFPVQNSPSDYVMIDGFISSINTKGVFNSISFADSKPIFSGTFEFECINPRTCDSVKVTHGRLDVNLNELQ